MTHARVSPQAYRFFVDLFRRETGYAAKAVRRVEHLRQVDQAHLPGSLLFAHHGLQREGGGTVASARIEVDEVDGLHRCRWSDASMTSW